MGNKMTNDEFIGSTITGVKIADDKQAMLLQTDRGDVVVLVDGDCCSHSWIENVDLPALGLPAKVISHEWVAMPDLGTPDEDECIAYYGHKIVTDRGAFLIDYRNSSNGYYGGSIHWPWDDYYYGGVHGQNVSKENWKDVTP
jgi:hypothetical protein